MAEPSTSRSASILEENMSKTLAEFLILYILSEKECYIGEVQMLLKQRSNGIIHIDSTYFFITRAYKAGYIVESGKRTASDGRLRQYYRITDTGLSHLHDLQLSYDRVVAGVTNILQKRGEKP